jgi:hypothetical protein
MNTSFQQNNFSLLGHKTRLVYQKMSAAPKAPESFKSPEKQTEAAMISEVAGQTPGDIFNDAVSAGGTIAGRHTGNTQILAALANTDPLGGGGGGGTSDDGSGTGAGGTSDDDSGTGGDDGTTTVVSDAESKTQAIAQAETTPKTQ